MQNMDLQTLLKKEKIYVSVSIVGDAEMQKLNSEFMKKDYPTDVLSFEIGEIQEDGQYYLGDVVVNKDQAERQAGDYDNSVEKELAELVEHGVLHLLGVHHEEHSNETSKEEK